MRLEDIRAGLSLTGIEPTAIVSVVATIPLGEGSLQLIYRTPAGAMNERLLGRADESSVGIASAERPFCFDGDGAAFQLACEGYTDAGRVQAALSTAVRTVAGFGDQRRALQRTNGLWVELS
jgi:hypothetical protein